jgi:hypothetical protein
MSESGPLRALFGPSQFGAYIEPPRTFGLALDDLSDDEQVRHFAEHGTRISWSTTLDDLTVFLTHAGGVFVEYPKRPAGDDPAGELNDQRARAVEPINLVLCELALSCGAWASAMSEVELASAIHDGDKIEVWAAAGPYAPAALALQASVLNGDVNVRQWEHTTAAELEQMKDLTVAMTLKAISPSLPAFVVGAFGHALRRRYAESVLFSWMACEQLLSYLWRELAVGNALDDDHRKHLRDGRTYPAAVQAENLRVAGRLPDDTYMLLTAARRHRNALAHNAVVGKTALTDGLQALYALLDVVDAMHPAT